MSSFTRPNYWRAAEAAGRLTDYYNDDSLQFEADQYGERGFYVRVFRAGDTAGLLLHVDEIDNGAAGIRENTLAMINSYRDGTPYQPVIQHTGWVYRDVMTLDGIERETGE